MWNYWKRKFYDGWMRKKITLTTKFRIEKNTSGLSHGSAATWLSWALSFNSWEVVGGGAVWSCFKPEINRDWTQIGGARETQWTTVAVLRSCSELTLFARFFLKVLMRTPLWQNWNTEQRLARLGLSITSRLIILVLSTPFGYAE